MNIKKNLTQLAKKNLMFRNIIRKSNNTYQGIKFTLATIGTKIDDKAVVFSCFNGKSYTDSPKAIYEYMQKDDKYNEYTFIWGFKNPEDYKILEDNKNTKVYKITSKEYKKALTKAKYWIFNYKLQDFIKPKKGQVFLQCWHGTPLKRLGCDLIQYDNELNTVKEMKKRYEIEAKKITYFISPSRYTTEKFISAWNLKEIGKENIIIEEGYPRNDFLFNYDKQDIDKIKRQIGIEDSNKKIILYAPTYRSNQHDAGIGYVYKEEVNFEQLKKELEDKYIILFRPHYFVANVFDFEKYKGFVYDVSRIDDINELYIISDILITDYSSVFFDYANLKKPMIFHMYDLEHYRDKSNGFYIDIEKELPGKITKTDAELIEEIKRLEKSYTYDEKYEKFNNKYNYLDDGNASKRVIEKVIG